MHRGGSRLQHLAHFDPLTGLLNRPQFHETLTKTLVHATATGQAVAVLLVDLDNLKNVNATCGTAIGDELLIQVSDRFWTCRPGCSHVGGPALA